MKYFRQRTTTLPSATLVYLNAVKYRPCCAFQLLSLLFLSLTLFKFGAGPQTAQAHT